MKLFSLFLLCFLQVACSQPAKPTTLQTISTLPEFFDCVRESDKLLVSAHRGGPTNRFPENALETFMNSTKSGMALLEVDVRISSDGVLFLYHDERLGRTSTGNGLVSEKNWDQLSQFFLKTKSGEITKYRIPTLETVLNWAITQNVILQLDIKPNTPIVSVIELIRSANAQNRVTIITYQLDQTKQWHQFAPELMLSTGASNFDQLQKVLNSGIDPKKLLLWTGRGQPQPELYQKISAAGLEVIAGTIGSVDQMLAKPENTWKVVHYETAGAVIIATGRSNILRQALQSDDDILESCPLPD